MAGRKRSASQLERPSGKRTRNSNKGVLHPPTLHAAPIVRTKIRFIVQTGGQYSILASNFADLINFPTAAGFTAYRVTNAYRIRSIEFWSPPSSSGSPVTTAFQWHGNSTAASDQSRVITDTGLGQDRPGHIKAVPPRNTSHSMWQISSGVTVCDFSCATGTVIDVDIMFTLNDVYSTSVATSTPPATAAVNVLCCKSLEGTSLILPIGWVVD